MEEPPPLPPEPLPDRPPDEEEDGWTAVWEPNMQAYYFANQKTGETTWENPRVAVKDRKEKEGKEVAFTGRFNRVTGKWQGDPEKSVENFTRQGKDYREMTRFFDVEGSADSHDGRSFRAERTAALEKMSRKELEKLKKEKRAKKLERRRAWLLHEEDPRERAKRLKRERLYK